MVGYQITFSIQRSQIDKKPSLWPNASLTQTKIPPIFGHPVASSADTRAVGRKKITAASKKKKMEENPVSAMVGQFRILPMAARLIMTSVKIEIIFFDISLHHDNF